MKNVQFTLFLLVAVSGFSFSARAVEKYPMSLGCKPDETVQFYEPSEGEPLKLDLFFPEGHKSSDERACVVFFFGGGWSGGNTSQFFGYAEYFASRGIVAISAQYRTKKSHGTDPRQCVEDGGEAIRYVREHANEIGIDPDKIIVGGGSAGGHVAVALAMCSNINSSPGNSVSCVPNALVLLNPVYDNGPGGYGHDRVVDYWKDISPFHNIRSGHPPLIAFFGSNDQHVPVSTINAFQRKMVNAGNECETHIYDGQTHGFFHISKGGREMFEDVLRKTDAFLVKRKYLSGKDTVGEWTAKSVAGIKLRRS